MVTRSERIVVAWFLSFITPPTLKHQSYGESGVISV